MKIIKDGISIKKVSWDGTRMMHLDNQGTYWLRYFRYFV